VQYRPITPEATAIISMVWASQPPEAEYNPDQLLLTDQFEEPEAEAQNISNDPASYRGDSITNNKPPFRRGALFHIWHAIQ
jgi:hypothetical protein